MLPTTMKRGKPETLIQIPKMKTDLGKGRAMTLTALNISENGMENQGEKGRYQKYYEV